MDEKPKNGKGSYVKDLVEGGEVEGVFLVLRKSARRTREGRPYLVLGLYDRSGTVDGQIWEDAEAFQVTFVERDYLRVRGVVDRFRERLQLRVVSCSTCPVEEVSPEDFLPASSRPAAEMRAELRARIRGLSDPHLKALLERFESDAAFMSDFVLAPAANVVHHAYVGGLLEHTLSLMAASDAVARVYPDVDRDLLLAGAFLHDVGKIRELRAEPGFPYTDEGQLLGHIVLGYEIAMRRIDALPGFPPDLRARLGHLILSHQGELEWGSPKRPVTLEALVLHFLDNLDSKVAVYRKAAGEGGEGAWTDYVRALGRSLYRAGGGPRLPREGLAREARGGGDPQEPPEKPPDLFGGR
ncbi:MAG: 3'-5' exoribonuclease YhaM family protein [Gemmatimonadota bacterium]